ncbi:MAG: phage tail protein [Anaerolineales bacterium]|nr:phage tail protein [Anaerolineales bacterium]
MSEPFVGEIKMFAGNFAPNGWAFCDGQLLAVSQNDALFSLLGTIYGGDGQTTFGLPDLRGRVPIHMGTGPGLSQRSIGTKAGSEQVTLNVNQLPSHSHAFSGTDSLATSPNPAGNVLAKSTGVDLYFADAPSVALANTALSSTGGSQAHTNLMPFQCVNFIIALFGIYPSSN